MRSHNISKKMPKTKKSKKTVRFAPTTKDTPQATASAPASVSDTPPVSAEKKIIWCPHEICATSSFTDAKHYCAFEKSIIRESCCSCQGKSIAWRECGHSFCFECFEIDVARTVCIICNTKRIIEDPDSASGEQLRAAKNLACSLIALKSARDYFKKTQRTLIATYKQ